VSRTVTVTITLSETGRITLDTTGPIAGPDGLLTLLEAARDIAAQAALGSIPPPP